MKIIKYVFLLLILGGSLTARAQDEIIVNVGFTYQNTDLRVDLYEVQPAYVFSVARTSIAKNLKKVPVGPRLKLPLRIKENEFKTFALVVENTTSKPRYFFATPHTVHPSQMSLDAIFECLCNHHVYKVPPRSVWYRVVRIKFENDARTWKGSKKVDLTHALVEVPESKALKEYRPLLFDQSDSSSAESERP